MTPASLSGGRQTSSPSTACGNPAKVCALYRLEGTSPLSTKPLQVPRIRFLALCVFHHQGKILVNVFDDPATGQTLCRPLGGGVEFGELAQDAITREIHEELGQPISDARLLGTLESLFTYAGKPGHEIVQVYDARFDDASLYEQDWLDGHESDNSPFRARWCNSADFARIGPLVPQGLQVMLRNLSLLD